MVQRVPDPEHFLNPEFVSRYHSRRMEARMEKNEANQPDTRGGVQVVSRTAAIMRALSAHPGGLSLTEIANEVKLPRSTVQRLVTALEIEGLVDGKDRKSTRLNSSHVAISYAVFCLKKKKCL